MILIADGGSTSCNWLGYNNLSSENVFEAKTVGVNPIYSSDPELESVLTYNNDLQEIRNEVLSIYFFGAGCNSVMAQNRLKRILSSYFGSAKKIIIQGDIQGAVYATANGPSVVSILGTGCNICYFDGNEVHLPIVSMGHLIMDEGSGTAIGRALLKSFFYGKMPKEIKQQFASEYNLDADYLKKNLYQEPFPGRFLASFAKFAFQDNQVFLQSLIQKEVQEYFENQIAYFKDQLKSCPIHFVGSIAYLAKPIIEDECNKRDYKLGKVVKQPIYDLKHGVQNYFF